MKRVEQFVTDSSYPLIADRILRQFKRDQSFLEHYHARFDRGYTQYPPNENSTDLPTTLLMEIRFTEKKIEALKNHLTRLLNITENMLGKVTEQVSFSTDEIDFTELRSALQNGMLWKIQRSSQKLVKRLSNHLDELLDKILIIRILNNFNQLMANLRKEDQYLSELEQRYDMAKKGDHRSESEVIENFGSSFSFIGNNQSTTYSISESLLPFRQKFTGQQASGEV